MRSFIGMLYKNRHVFREDGEGRESRESREERSMAGHYRGSQSVRRDTRYLSRKPAHSPVKSPVITPLSTRKGR